LPKLSFLALFGASSLRPHLAWSNLACPQATAWRPVVEVLSGPHRLVSLMTAEAVDELGLAVGDEVVCTAKATQITVEIPG